MTCYLIQNRYPYFYICESNSIWVPGLKKPRSERKNIASIDKDTGKIRFYSEFLDRFKGDFIKINNDILYIRQKNIKLNILKGKDISNNNEYKFEIDENINNNKNHSENKQLIQQNDSQKKIKTENIIKNLVKEFHGFKSYGLNYFFNEIIKKIGLLSVLQSIYPDIWQKIFILVMYIISENDAMEYCEDFVDLNDTYAVNNFNSQRISELFDKITAKSRELFFKNWINIAKEDEFLALDVTSVSSYSKTIDYCEFGYNKDHENLPQINMCVLFGEKSLLPMYQTVYEGSLNDVTILSCIINQFYDIIGDFNFKLVMDKGFYSRDNISFIISKKDIKFIISVPLDNNYLKNIIISDLSIINNMSNYIKTNIESENLRGLHHYIYFEKDKIYEININNTDNLIKEQILSLYIFFSPCKATKEREEFYLRLNEINNYVKEHKKIEKYRSEIKKFFITEYDKLNNTQKFTYNDEAINEHLKFAGYFALLSNTHEKKEYIITIYRKKDVVEKCFNITKKNLGLNRYYIQGNKRMVNKSFIIFISQIVYCYIYKIMSENNKFKKMTIKKLLKQLQKLRSYIVLDQKHLMPLTKSQKLIFDWFNFDYPKL